MTETEISPNDLPADVEASNNKLIARLNQAKGIILNNKGKTLLITALVLISFTPVLAISNLKGEDGQTAIGRLLQQERKDEDITSESQDLESLPESSPTMSASPSSSPTLTAASPTPIITSTPTTAPRTPNPPIINITYPSEMQSIEFSNPGQQLCLSDTPGGGDTSGLQRNHALNGGAWSGYSPMSTLCFSPNEGLNTIQLRYRNQHGDESTTYTRKFSVYYLKEISITLSGQLYQDLNCNNNKDSGEGGVNTPATINIFKMPEFSVYATITSDNNGNFSYSGKIKENEQLTLKPIPVSPAGYKSNPHYNDPELSFNSSNRSRQINIPQVPNENVDACF
jgi:hypothetical protein